jgi:hypothetical protein
MLLVFVLTACGGGGDGEQAPSVSERKTVDQPDLYPGEYQIHVIYAIPRDQPDEQFDINGEIATSLEASNNHFKKISGGKHIRYDMSTSGKHDITFLRLPDLNEDYAAQGRSILNAIKEDAVAAG